MSERDPLLDGLLGTARQDPEPSAADKQRVRASLMAAIAVGAPPSSGLPEVGASGGGAAAGATAGSAAKWWVVATLVAGGGAGLMWTGGPASTGVESSAAPPAIAAPVAVQEAPAPAAELDVPELQPAAVADPANTERVEDVAPDGRAVTAVAPRPRRRPTASPGAAQPQAPAPDAELALIRAATQALARHEGATAMRLLDAHRKQHAGGIFALEADGLRVLAHCELGQLAVGRRARDAFLQRAPQAPLAARVRAACAAGDGDSQ